MNNSHHPATVYLEWASAMALVFSMPVSKHQVPNHQACLRNRTATFLPCVVLVHVQAGGCSPLDLPA